MNFDGIREFQWRFGYAFAIVLMLAAAVALHVLFNRRNWMQ
jgi:magnesium transporter